MLEERFSGRRHEDAASSRKASFLFAEAGYIAVRGVSLLLVLLAGSLARAEVLIERGSIWRYHKGTEEFSEPIDAWRTAAFDDSSWTPGKAPFRFGDGSGGTLLADMEDTYSTLYLRATFDLAAGDGPETLRLTVDFDDGFIVWINGEKVRDVNGPASPGHDSLATGSHESGSFESFVLDDADDYLVAGTNIVAVQGFNSTLSSNDFLINVELESIQRVADTRFSRDRGLYAEPFSVTITTATPGATIRYTTDGSEPTETLGTIYSSPIDIDGTTVLRAIAYRSGMEPTNVDTQTYIFPAQVIRQPRSIPGWQTYDYTSGTGSPSTHDYEMDPEIVDSPAYRDVIIDALRSIPTMCLSMDRDTFWSVYRGSAEAAASIELIYPDDPAASQQEDCEVVRHSHNRVKNSLRLRFKTEFGAAKFQSDIFRRARLNGGSAVDSFDRIVLRAGNNRSWARNFNNGRCAYTRDQWYRDSEIEMTGSGAHGEFVHFYVNGIYWGLYNPCEKPDAWFGSAYFGGEREDWWDSSDHGDATRWNYLRGPLRNKDMRVSANYEELQRYLDVERFCDYVILTWMTGMTDWPGNNWKAVNRNQPVGPVMYFGWDCEWSWDTTASSNLGAWVHPDFRRGRSGGATIAAIWNAAKHNDDFMMLFADRVYRHCFNDGALTDERSRERWAILNDVIRDAMVAESARWGDASRVQPYTRDVTWQNEVDRLDALMDGNVERLINALLREGYYTRVGPPLFSIDGVALERTAMTVAAGFDVRIESQGASEVIYYTTDGSDPRLPGGSPAAGAIDGGVETVIPIHGATILRARTLGDGEWSPLHETVFYVLQDFAKLRITEIMYHPPDDGPVSGKQLEFLELKNVGGDTIDLSGVRITSGIDYAFPFGRLLGPGGHALLVANDIEFAERYTDVPIEGVYEGSLSNSGETVTLSDLTGDAVVSVTYDDHSPWEEGADGDGYSLVPVSAVPVWDQNHPSSWRRSESLFGSPGEDEGDVFNGAPYVERPPRDVNVFEGERAVFTVLATGFPLPRYQWRRDGRDIAGATEWTYTTPPATPGDHGARMSCVITNAVESIETAAAVLTVSSPPVRGQLVTGGETWRYSKGTREPSTPAAAWRAPGFDDASWASGATPIGYGDPPFGTMLNDMEDNYSTVYLRRHFSVPGNLEITALEILADFDDGFIAWINGVEVLRVNAANGEIAFDGEASASHESGSYETFELEGPLDFLVAGDNVLAVHALNFRVSSNDMKLGLELSYEALRASPTELSRFVRGDSNGDWSVDLSDAVDILTILFLGRVGDSCDDARDVDDDGDVDITDAVTLLDYLFGGGKAPPPPFTIDGSDPTEDALDCDREAR